MNIRRINARRRQRGSFIIEASLGWGVLMIIAILMLKFQVNSTRAQQWTVMQTLTDARLTQETALGTRWPFNDLTGENSPWPTYPSADSSSVTVGLLPGGRPVQATLIRTKQADGNNLPAAAGSGDDDSNPAKMEAWKVISILSYKIGEREYVKSRVTLRTR